MLYISQKDSKQRVQVTKNKVSCCFTSKYGGPAHTIFKLGWIKPTEIPAIIYSIKLQWLFYYKRTK